MGEGIVLEVVACEKGFDVVVDGRVAVINIVVDVFSKFVYSRAIIWAFCEELIELVIWGMA